MPMAFVGLGNVGGALADRLQRVGHDATLAASDARSGRVKKLLARNPALKIAAAVDAVDGAEVVVLAIPFQVNV